MKPLARASVFRFVGLGTLALLILAAHPAGAQETEYIDALSAQLEIASDHFDAAATAIGACNDELLDCLRDSAATVHQVELAAQGLERVSANLSALEVPARFATSHARLQSGFGHATDGMRRYNEGLAEYDLDKLGAAAELIRLGKDEIDAAKDAILSRPPDSWNLLLILGGIIVATVVVLAVLVYMLLRETAKDRRSSLLELATCPECEEVLDGWESFRRRQIREWRKAHLESHRRGEGPESERGREGSD